MPKVDLFDVIFRGKRIEGVTEEQATSLLSQKLKISSGKAAKVVAASNCRIAKNVDLDKAKAIRNSFSECGLILMIIYVDTIVEQEQFFSPEEVKDDAENHSASSEDNRDNAQPIDADDEPKQDYEKLKKELPIIIAGIVACVVLYFLLRYYKILLLGMIVSGIGFPIWRANAGTPFPARIIKTLCLTFLLTILSLGIIQKFFPIF